MRLNRKLMRFLHSKVELIRLAEDEIFYEKYAKVCECYDSWRKCDIILDAPDWDFVDAPLTFMGLAVYKFLLDDEYKRRQKEKRQ